MEKQGVVDRRVNLLEETLLSLIRVESFDQGLCGRKADSRHGQMEKELDRYCEDLKKRGVYRFRGGLSLYFQYH